MSVETRVVEIKGLKAVDVAVVAVLLAVGAVLRMFVPPFVGITPNFVIGMYCLAILLLRPKLAGIIGIGLVAAGVCQVTTKSLIPFLNFISEPVGAIVVGVLALIKAEFGILKYVRPFIITFIGTAAWFYLYLDYDSDFNHEWEKRPRFCRVNRSGLDYGPGQCGAGQYFIFPFKGCSKPQP